MVCCQVRMLEGEFEYKCERCGKRIDKVLNVNYAQLEKLGGHRVPKAV